MASVIDLPESPSVLEEPFVIQLEDDDIVGDSKEECMKPRIFVDRKTGVVRVEFPNRLKHPAAFKKITHNKNIAYAKK